MPFTDYRFLVFLLPAATGGFWLARRYASDAAAQTWLLIASAVFCAWTSPTSLAVLTVSALFHYRLSRTLAAAQGARRRAILILGLLAGVSTLVVFKCVRTPFGLPLGISFYTFVQIYYLLDVYRREAEPPSLRDYLLLVGFFPKFVAGPIVRPADSLPLPAPRNISRQAVALGLALFLMGFAKKLLADNCASWVDPVFAAISKSQAVSPAAAWIAVLAYSFQIYFDFSGYSDMAIGLGRLFGWSIPVNFNSPYKASGMIEFWRRWHITLTGFLTENVYFRLPGQRKGALYQHRNLFLTMVLCGFWHGAGWTFGLWGAFHGICLIVNHIWRAVRRKRGWTGHAPALARILTWACIAAGWVLFRAPSLGSAKRMLSVMLGFGDPASPWTGTALARVALQLAALGLLACAGPNTQEIIERSKDRIAAFAGRVAALHPAWVFPGLATLWLIGVMLFLTRQNAHSPFIYAIF